MRNIVVGAHLIKAPASKPGIEHYLVLLTLTNGFWQWYGVFEKTTKGLHWYETASCDEAWVIERRVEYRDLPSVLARLRSARTWTGYDQFLDNCEQFGRFVIQGKHFSTQVRAGAVAVACIGVLALLSKD